MIQRIQSVYLFLAALILPILLRVPFAAFDVDSRTSTHTLFQSELPRADGSTIITPGSLLLFIVMIVAGLVILEFLVAIFLFKKRKLQIIIVYLGITGLIAILGMLGYTIVDTMQTYSSDGLNASLNIGRSAGLLIPLISLVLAWLAVRNIKKDEELVRSADRIR